MLALLTGLATGLSLIVAIGAQNAFVLRQGLLRRRVLGVVLVCIASDAVLIAAGLLGLGALLTARPAFVTVVTWLGAAFLVGYGATAARRAWRGGSGLDPATEPAGRQGSAVLTALALTWLNPHVFLDTLLLLPALAATQGGDRWLFAAGTLLASTLWFTALGYGARLLRPLFARPRAWQVLDATIALVMLAIAARLVISALGARP